MNSSIKWGIVGNATIARKCVIPAIFNSENGRIQALASRIPKEAETLAEKYDIAQLYAKYESVIEDKQVDVVYIPLPNHLHREWTIRALEA
jgi:predicted dehydrogenase